MVISFWREVDNTLKYKHLQIVDDSELHEVVDYLM